MKLATTILLLIMSSGVYSQTAGAQAKDYNLSKTSLAIEGYDPVAYFVENKAVKGNKANTVSYNGVIYYFANAANKDIFLKNPSKYEPQYGGWCAFAMGDSGEKVEVDPETFKIKDGKLYLFYNKYFNNTLKSWNKNEMGLQAKADQNWKKIIQH